MPRRRYAAPMVFIRICWHWNNRHRKCFRWKRVAWCAMCLPPSPRLQRVPRCFLPCWQGAVDILPADAFEDHEERVDSRTTNSWLLRMDEVSAPEMLEVQLVNSVAPFLLNSPLQTSTVAFAVCASVHRQCVGNGRAVSASQDCVSSPHQHGESRPET